MSSVTAAPTIFTTMVMIKDNAIFLVKRAHDVAHLGGYYALIGGKPHENEALIDCAIREAHEEAGVTIEPTQVSFMGVSDIFFEGRHLIGFNFFAHTWQGTPTRNSPREHESAEWIDLKQLPEQLTPGTRLALAFLQNQDYRYVKAGWPQ